MQIFMKVEGVEGYDFGFDSIGGISLFIGDTLILTEQTPADFGDALMKYLCLNDADISKLEKAKKLANTMSLCKAFSGQEDGIIIKMAPNGAHTIKIQDGPSFGVNPKREWPNDYVSIIQTCEERILKIREEQSSKQRRYDNIMRLINERYPKFLDACR